VALAAKVTFEFLDMPLSEVLDFLGMMAKVKISVAPAQIKKGVDKTLINLRVTDMELRVALEWVARLAELEVLVEKGAIVLEAKRPQPTAEETGMALAKLDVEANGRAMADVLTDISKLPNSKFAATTDALIALKDKPLAQGKSNARALLAEIMKDPRFACTQQKGVLTLDVRAVPEWENEIRRALSRKVTFAFTDTPWDEAISFISALTKVNIILDPNVAGAAPAITLSVKDELMGSALAAMLSKARLAADFRSNAIYITKKENMLFPVDLTGSAVAAPAPAEKPLPAADF